MTQLSMTGKKWMTENAVDLKGKSEAEFLLTLAKIRGIDLREEDRELTSPTKLYDIQKAKDRIKRAIENVETIAIFGDYDCDGVTASVQLARYFHRHGVDPIVRLPHRIRDGYGLKTKHIDEFAERDVKLLITADCGVSSVEAVRKAQASGIDVIITDHHSVPEELPPAFAIVHPALSDYPLPHPCGAGVVFQLLRALEGQKWEGYELDLALSMTGTVADIVDLRGDNRTLVIEGLQACKELLGTPLGKLFALAGVSMQSATVFDIGFKIAPRINAAGRMDDAILAFDALMGDMQKIARLSEINAQRQTLTLDQFRLLSKEFDSLPKETFALCKVEEDYHEGIVGLLAGRLTEVTGKPSMIGVVRDGLCTASLRAPRSIHITNALKECSDLLQGFGGHAQAAGCTFSHKNFERLAEKLSLSIAAQVDHKPLYPTCEVDAVISPEHLSLNLIENLHQKLGPFGAGNAVPRFLVARCEMRDARKIGSEKNHLSGYIGNCKCIAFGYGEHIESTQEPLDLVCELDVNEWNGRREVQLNVKDMRISERQLACSN